MNRKSIYKIILYFILLVGGVPVLYAQISQGGFPLPEQLSGNKNLRSFSASSSSQIPFIEMPSFDKEKLLREDSLPGNRIRGIRFAYKFNVSIAPDNAGISTVLDDGTKVWRVGIRSKDAFSLNILFTEFLLPPEAKVFVYSPDRNNILGAFTEANNQPAELLPIAPIDGDEIIVEYSEPANALFRGKLKIGEVNHDYLGLRALPAFDKSQPCEVNATCNDIHTQQRRSACLIIVDGDTYCSGNLVNNTDQDGAPYVLSAAHCLYGSRNELILSKAQTSIFFFNYEAPYCFSDIQGTMEMSVAGATAQASDKQRDMLLLRLNEAPPLDYRVYYAGWNASESVSSPAYCFHHPNGDIKKISIENDTPFSTTFTGGNLFLPNGHWRVDQWEQGITERGSSGSGLFDAGNRIIGNLSGGNPYINCTNRGDDNFYKLGVAWDASADASKNLKPWLDPANVSTLVLDGKEQDENPCIRLSNWIEGERLHGSPSSNGYAAGHNKLGITEFAERFSSPERSELYGIFFLPQKGLYSASSPVIAQIYSGNTAPENLLHQQVVKITNTIYQSGSGFSEKNLAYFRQKENYLRFPQPVAVDTSFFVVFKLPQVPVDTFALYYTVDRNTGGLNTAWFKEGTVWKPFYENPLFSRPASLMVNAVVRFSGLDSTDQVYAAQAKTEIYPNPTKNELTVLFIENKYPVQLRLTDLSGRVLFVKNNLSGLPSYILQTSLFCEKGIFFLHIIYSDRTDVLKFIKL
jgi:hypothetical protein